MSTATNPNPPRVPGGAGETVRRIDGLLKVTGGSRYASDMPESHPAYANFHTSATRSAAGIAVAVVAEIAATLNGREAVAAHAPASPQRLAQRHGICLAQS